MHYTRTGSGVLALAGGTYLTGGLAATAAILFGGGVLVLYLEARRRRQDRTANGRSA